MKALVCAACMDIRALEPHGEWTTCRCGSSSARWLDPKAGTVKCKGSPRNVRILGLNNRYLLEAVRSPEHEDLVTAGGQWEWWRQLHDKAIDAPNYIFDKSKRACWATVVLVGETNDISWEEPTST